MHLSGLFADSEDAWRQGRHALTSAFSGMKMKMVINKNIIANYYCIIVIFAVWIVMWAVLLYPMCRVNKVCIRNHYR